MLIGTVRLATRKQGESMTFVKRPNRQIFLVPLALLAAFGVTGSLASAQSRISVQYPKGSPSYVFLDSNGTRVAIDESPCTTSGCPNGIRFTFAPGKCVETASKVYDRYPPVAALLTVKHKVPANNGPMIAPCATALVLTWTPTNALMTAGWQNGSGPVSSQAYLPKHVNGTGLFFQAGESLVSAEWTRYGKPAGSIPAFSFADDAYWAGSSSAPPTLGARKSAGHAARRSTAAPPKVVLFGREGKSTGTSTDRPPAKANGVDLSWYQNLFQSGPGRGCVAADGSYWTAPAMAYVYTTAGVPNARVSVLKCPTDVHGNPIEINDVTFSWTVNLYDTGYVLDSAVPTYNGVAIPGLPSGAIEQPPAGTDGMQFAFHLDDFRLGHWTKNGHILHSKIHAPAHVKVGSFFG
jgi:hypothetical protein